MLEGAQGGPVAGAAVTILDKNREVVLQSTSDEAGIVRTELPEYSVKGRQKTTSSPYTMLVGGLEKEVNLDRNKSITMTLNSQ